MTPLDFDFELPEVQIARFPLPKRDASRLLVVGATNEDHHIHALPALLRAGDLLVLNDVRVRRARLSARRATGGEVEALLVGPDEALLRPSRRLKVGERLVCGDGHLLLLQQRADGCWQVRGEPDMATLERTAGSLPIPPYLGRQAEEADAERYQTVYASERSGFAASAAPTAGLHISPELLDQLKERGVELARVGLEVGLGTFQPLREEQLREGKLHAERYDLPVETWEAIERTRARGGRVVAVGTTATRVLESASGPGQGETTLFIRPGFQFRQVDLLLTNFHLPQSSLLMLVCAFGGRERVLNAYAHAISAGYRFYSYGDAMLLQRA